MRGPNRKETLANAAVVIGGIGVGAGVDLVVIRSLGSVDLGTLDSLDGLVGGVIVVIVLVVIGLAIFGLYAVGSLIGDLLGSGAESRLAHLKLLRWAGGVLPTEYRHRYLEEWAAHVIDLPRRRRLRHTSGLILGVPRLALVLRWPLGRRVR
jgi:hypothetical protein